MNIFIHRIKLQKVHSKMNTAPTTTPFSSTNSSETRSCGKVHVRMDNYTDIPVIRYSLICDFIHL